MITEKRLADKGSYEIYQKCYIYALLLFNSFFEDLLPWSKLGLRAASVFYGKGDILV